MPSSVALSLLLIAAVGGMMRGAHNGFGDIATPTPIVAPTLDPCATFGFCSTPKPDVRPIACTWPTPDATADAVDRWIATEAASLCGTASNPFGFPIVTSTPPAH